MARWKDHRRFKGNGVTVYLDVELEITKHNDLLVGYHADGFVPVYSSQKSLC